MNTSAWKTDDKAWMKARRASWKEVKNTLDRLTGVRGRDKKFLKEFYMSGEIDIDAMVKVYGRRVVDPERLLYPMEAATLLECWLTANQSDENWQHIKEKYGERKLYHSCRRLLESLDYYPEAGSFFSGVEERLYRFLCPTRCRPEDYPGLNEVQYQEQSRRVWAQVTRNIDKFMRSEHPNPCNFVRHRLPEWKDAIVPTWKLRGDGIVEAVAGTLCIAQSIVTAPEQSDPLAVEVAQEIMKQLNDPKLPNPFKEMIADVMSE